MGPKKGKSLEEKRQCLLRIYHETLQPYNLKEIEKEGSKVGVVQQVIKDVNQSLADDNLICSDKIGSGVFFWSFPCKAIQDTITDKANVDKALQTATANIETLKGLKRKVEANRCNIERNTKLQRLLCLQTEEQGLKSIIESSKENDPVEIERIIKLGTANQESANRWVDNTYAVKSFLTKKQGMQSKQADKYLGINDDFDYYDDTMVFKAVRQKISR